MENYDLHKVLEYHYFAILEYQYLFQQVMRRTEGNVIETASKGLILCLTAFAVLCKYLITCSASGVIFFIEFKGESPESNLKSRVTSSTVIGR